MNDQSQTTLTVKVTPRAKIETIKLETMENGETLYRVYVRTPPEDGKANKAVIKLLAKHFNRPKSDFQIETGETSRHKRISINTK